MFGPGRGRRVVGVVLGLATSLVATVASTSVARADAVDLLGPGVQAVIQYTEFGIPHITADSFDGLGYGYGFAVARDNVCELAKTYVTLAGQRSRFFGPDASSDTGIGDGSDNLTSDLYFQQVNDSGVVQRLAGAPVPEGARPEIAQLVAGYVAGYNRFLRDDPPSRISDPACHDAPWVRPITAIDVYRHIYALSTLDGDESLMSGIVDAQPPVSGAARQAGSTTAAMVTALRRAHSDAQHGSNAIGVGRDATTSAASVLLGNPHFPWQGSLRFWQSQLTIPGRLDATGASLIGVPLILIGHNENVAWSHTVSTTTTFGLYQIPTVPGTPTEYVVDGRPEAMTSRQVTVGVRAADGGITHVSRTLWSTRYGPVLTAIPGAATLPWGATVFAVRDANSTDLRLLNTWLGIDMADDTQQVAAAESTWQGVPWVDTVATDRNGTALFDDVQVAPNVSDTFATDCGTTLGQEIYPATGLSILDGSRSACRWPQASGTIDPGVMSPDTMPRLRRDDLVANFNDSPWLTNPRAPITNYPREVGDVATERSVRTQEGLLAVEARIAGTDGQPGRGFSLATMSGVLFGDQSREDQLAADGLAALCATFPKGMAPSSGAPVDVTSGCRALRGWNGRYTTTARGAALFEAFASNLADIGDAVWLRPFDPADPLHTPNSLAVADPDVARAFGDAAARLASLGIPQDAPLGASQFVVRGGLHIPLPGGSDPVGVLNVVSAEPDPAHGGVTVDFGSSFIQIAQFPRSGGDVRASTLLTYSESGDPTSPHYRDQTVLFSLGQLVADRFTQQQILASPDLRVDVLAERR